MDDSLGSGTENKTPLYISIAALALALLALLFAFTTRSKADKVQESLAGVDLKTFVTKSTLESSLGGVAKLSDLQVADQKLEDFKVQVITQFERVGTAVSEQNRIISSLGSRSTAPTRNSGTGTATVAAPGEYVIKSGDTFAKIARANGISQAAITKANPGVDSSKLKIGQKIKLPSKN